MHLPPWDSMSVVVIGTVNYSVHHDQYTDLACPYINHRTPRMRLWYTPDILANIECTHTHTCTHTHRIAPGEVFVLLSRLNDDWGWGRSQKTGDSGLIPIVIMEHIVSLILGVVCIYVTIL